MGWGGGPEGERQGGTGPLPGRLRAQAGERQEVGFLSPFLSPAVIVTPVNFLAVCTLRLACPPCPHPALVTVPLLGVPSSAVAYDLGLYGSPSPSTQQGLAFTFQKGSSY